MRASPPVDLLALAKVNRSWSVTATSQPAQVGPVLDRALVDDSFACRTGKGALAAVERAQQHARRWPWWAKIDIRAYFASIVHAVLAGLLEAKFKDRGLLGLLRRIVAVHEDAPGKGLPIGALTSQQFANFYLSGLDRLLLEGCRVSGLVRYMDDLVWWGGTAAPRCAWPWTAPGPMPPSV